MFDSDVPLYSVPFVKLHPNKKGDTRNLMVPLSRIKAELDYALRGYQEAIKEEKEARAYRIAKQKEFDYWTCLLDKIETDGFPKKKKPKVSGDPQTEGWIKVIKGINQ